MNEKGREKIYNVINKKMDIIVINMLVVLFENINLLINYNRTITLDKIINVIKDIPLNKAVGQNHFYIHYIQPPNNKYILCCLNYFWA